MKIRKEKKNKDSNLKWLLTICFLTFILSLFFSYISTESIKDIPIIPALIILVAVILMGIIFDIIAIAVTIASEDEFHAKASKKVKGAKTAIYLIRNSHKVANFCADVIGDIASVLSGAISALIAIKISASYNFDFDTQILISAIVASLTVGGKAIGKGIAKSNNTKIVHIVSTIINKFKRR